MNSAPSITAGPWVHPAWPVAPPVFACGPFRFVPADGSDGRFCTRGPWRVRPPFSVHLERQNEEHRAPLPAAAPPAPLPPPPAPTPFDTWERDRGAVARADRPACPARRAPRKGPSLGTPRLGDVSPVAAPFAGPRRSVLKVIVPPIEPGRLISVFG